MATTEKRTNDVPAAAGGDHRTQLKHLKAHLAFQRQEKCEKAKIDWCTVITKSQSRDHITRHLHLKINRKVVGYHGPGKIDTDEGQEALRTTARHVAMRVHYGGNGFSLIGWNLGFRMYRERSLRRGIAEEAFWEITVGERNTPRLSHKEESFPPEIQYRHAMFRYARELVRKQGANPKRHRDAQAIRAFRCPRCRETTPRETVLAQESPECPGCEFSLRHQISVDMAFTGSEPPVLIGPDTYPSEARDDGRGRNRQEPYRKEGHSKDTQDKMAAD